MSNAVILVNCEPNTNKHVSKELNRICGIKEADPVFGAYDCIATTDDMPTEDIRTLVNASIRPLDYIRSVLTLNVNG